MLEKLRGWKEVKRIPPNQFRKARKKGLPRISRKVGKVNVVTEGKENTYLSKYEGKMVGARGHKLMRGVASSYRFYKKKKK